MESLPPENIRTGFSNSAATSRKMWIDFRLQLLELAQAVVGMGQRHQWMNLSSATAAHIVLSSGGPGLRRPVRGRCVRSPGGSSQAPREPKTAPKVRARMVRSWTIDQLST